jgi:nitrogenase-associated protein
MATVIFYEKPGCANNTRQKKLLTEAGHNVIAKNILEENWQAEILLPFFTGLAVRDWFNYSAPPIKYGEIEPDKLDANQAIALMLENSLLIHRPLMQVGNEYRAGFDAEKVNTWLGLTAINKEQDLETCTKSHAAGSCRHEQT